MAMIVLRNGDSAVAAVEAAIRVLEDKEITNAGYGSNLTIEGVVECDATIVDHLGRSGACGATASMFAKPFIPSSPNCSVNLDIMTDKIVMQKLKILST